MKSIKGTIEFEIQYDDNGYQFNYDQSLINDVAANLIVVLNTSADIKNIKENLKSFKGKDEKTARTTLSKLSQAKSVAEIVADKLFNLYMSEQANEKD